MEGRTVLNFLKRWFKPRLRKDYYTYNYSNKVWGHHFEFVDKISSEGMPRTIDVWGHYTPRPVNGDLLKMKMQSGRTMLWAILNCEYPGDPHDMFFATIYGLGYSDEYSLPESTNKMMKSDFLF